MFFVLKDQFDTRRLPKVIEEVAYKYYKEPKSTLRKYANDKYELKSVLAVSDYGPLRARMSLEREIVFKNESKHGKITQYKDGIRRIKVRDIVVRKGYEIHFTNVNDSDRYIEFELVDDHVDYVALEEDVSTCMQGLDLKIPQIWEHDIIHRDMKIVKPIDMSRRVFRANRFIMDHCYVTNKLDGERKFVFCQGGYVITVSTKGQHDVLGFSDLLDGVWIFDTEYYDKRYYIFDVLMAGGHNMTELPIIERMSTLNGVQLPSVLEIKHGEIVDNQEKFYNYLLKCSKDKKNDGIIIYNPTAPYETSAIKYKYAPTIDVKTNFKEVYVSNGGIDYMVYIDFEGKHSLSDPAIVECSYKDGKLKYLRSRLDKEKPNSLRVYDNFIDLYENNQLLAMESIYPDSDDVFLMQAYHNVIKSDIIKGLKGKLLDIGSGRGGDINKWLSNRDLRLVECVEPNPENFKELMKRLSKASPKHVKTYNVAFNDFDCGKKTYDCITSLFMINCVSPAQIKSFIQKMYDLLEPNGIAHVIMMDSDRVKSNKFIRLSGNMYSVNYPGTMVVNHREYKYSYRQLKEYAEAIGFDVSKGEFLKSSWLRGIHARVSQMYCKFSLVKPEGDWAQM